MKKTKIIATIGPASSSEEQIIALYKAGVNIIRFNFSHAQYENVKKQGEIIKNLNSIGKTNLSLLLDTKGPEIRTGDLKEKISYEKGDQFSIYIKNYKEEGKNLFCDYPYLVEDLQVGEEIVIDSGLFNVKVIEKSSDFLKVEALNDCVIGSRRHINLPGINIRLPGINEKDKEDIKFGIEHGFDFIAASFIRNKENLNDIRNFLDENGGKEIKIISKIENAEGIKNMDEIIKNSDGTMVARGDLGIEVPVKKLPIYQKQIIEKCRREGKIVIVATHLLESMIENPFPTRAESSDVFNATLQKPDCLMLSGESAMGKFPIKSVMMMRDIIEEAESIGVFENFDYTDIGLRTTDIEKKLLIKSAFHIAPQLNIKAVVIFTKSGLLARLASAYRPNLPVYAFTKFETSKKFTNILYGIQGFHLKEWNQEKYVDNLEKSIQILLEKSLISENDSIIAVTDIQRNNQEIPIMEIIQVQKFI